MTDKIMIDGVDVSECHCYVDNNKEYSCGEHCSKFHYRYCGDNPNCYYKQLKRKEDLINEIEDVIKPYQEEIEADAFSLPSAIKSVLQRKEQECEELKERIKCNCFDPKSNNNRCISYNRIAEDYEKDLKHLKNKIAECEKYEQLFDELDKRVSNCIEIYDCIIVSKIVKDIIIKAKGEGNE